jgi:hypothetical protein
MALGAMATASYGRKLKLQKLLVIFRATYRFFKKDLIWIGLYRNKERYIT